MTARKDAITEAECLDAIRQGKNALANLPDTLKAKVEVEVGAVGDF